MLWLSKDYMSFVFFVSELTLEPEPSDAGDVVVKPADQLVVIDFFLRDRFFLNPSDLAAVPSLTKITDLTYKRQKFNLLHQFWL